MGKFPSRVAKLSLPGFSSRYKRESGAEKKKSRQPCIFISMREKGNAAQTWGKRKERGLANRETGKGVGYAKGRLTHPSTSVVLDGVHACCLCLWVCLSISKAKLECMQNVGKRKSYARMGPTPMPTYPFFEESELP